MDKFILSSFRGEASLVVRGRRGGSFYLTSKRALKSFVHFLKSISDIFMHTGAYVSELTLLGVGFKFLSFDRRVLQVTLGYSHDLYIFLPKGLSYCVFKQYLALFSHDKALVTQTSSQVRALRVPDAYKGKGVRYLNELMSVKKGKQKQR